MDTKVATGKDCDKLWSHGSAAKTRVTFPSERDKAVADDQDVRAEGDASLLRPEE